MNVYELKSPIKGGWSVSRIIAATDKEALAMAQAKDSLTWGSDTQVRALGADYGFPAGTQSPVEQEVRPPCPTCGRSF